MCRTEMTAALRGAQPVSPAIAARAASAIDVLVDVLVDLHAYHDVPGRKDPVLKRLFDEGAAALRSLDIPFSELTEAS